MSKIILGIETATDACSVAIITPAQCSDLLVIEPQSHAKLLLGMIDEVCSQVGVNLKEIDAFAFGRGPGSFTGVRIAASVIQGLAFGVVKPVIAVSSLQALAQQAFNIYGYKNVTAILDARMQEIYYGNYCVAANGLMSVVNNDSITKPESLEVDASDSYVAVGTGAVAYGPIIKQNNQSLIIESSILYPRAKEVVQIALDLFNRGEILAPSEAVPTYIRDDVAKKSKKNPDQGSRDKN